MLNEFEILEILEDWNFWNKELDIGVKREHYLKKIKLSKSFVIGLIGIRRSGKSQLLKQIAYELMKKGVKKQNILIVNFEDFRFPENIDTELLNKIYLTYLHNLKPQGEIYVFLDEISKVKNWDKWIRTFLDTKKGYLLITDSSARLIKNELSSTLTGRHIEYEIYPLNFKEYLEFKNIRIKNLRDSVVHQAKIKEVLKEHLEYGSFPEIALTENKEMKIKIITSLLNDLINRDVVERYNIRKIKELRNLVKYLLTNISKPFTYRSLSNALNISTDTALEFLEYLQEIFLFFEIKKYSHSLKVQQKSEKKIYVIDNGFLNERFSFFDDFSKKMENLVFSELLKNGHKEIYYYKTSNNKEIDFLIIENATKKLIEVCYEFDNEHESKILKAMEELNLKEATCISWETEKIIEKNQKTINVIPLWKWLLGL